MYLPQITLFFSLFLCSSELGTTDAAIIAPPHAGFNEYWYSGQAEITSYTLDQARYGENHPGTSVIVFVTEPFSKKEQVKLDQPSGAGADAVSVLKMNRQRSFNTGIYPYRVMTSLFTPVEIEQYPHSLKSTNSVQEWCGHTYNQFNYQKDKKYSTQLFSYFESEGDQSGSFTTDFLEDELFTRMRINPKSLPTGEFNVVPSQTYNRFIHRKAQSYAASGQIKKDGKITQYVIQYKDLPRRLIIHFKSQAPYEIEGWQEEYRGLKAFGPTQKTIATKINRVKSPYWNQNSVRDTTLYQSLMQPSETTE